MDLLSSSDTLTRKFFHLSNSYFVNQYGFGRISFIVAIYDMVKIVLFLLSDDSNLNLSHTYPFLITSSIILFLIQEPKPVRLIKQLGTLFRHTFS